MRISVKAAVAEFMAMALFVCVKEGRALSLRPPRPASPPPRLLATCPACPSPPLTLQVHRTGTATNFGSLQTLRRVQ